MGGAGGRARSAELGIKGEMMAANSEVRGIEVQRTNQRKVLTRGWVWTGMNGEDEEAA